jgi:hypothetical protein
MMDVPHSYLAIFCLVAYRLPFLEGQEEIMVHVISTKQEEEDEVFVDKHGLALLSFHCTYESQ